jgi:hypothetical protein
VFCCNQTLSYNISAEGHHPRFRQPGIAALNFSRTVGRQIHQTARPAEHLAAAIRPDQSIPRMSEYQPARIEDELPDLVFYTVDTQAEPPRLTIQSDGTRMSAAYGNTGKGRYLDEYLGARLAPMVMPVYYACIERCLPAYTIANIDDIYGRIVAYERLLLPFSDDGSVTHHRFAEDHQRGRRLRDQEPDARNDKLPVLKLRTIIDRDLFHRAPGRIPSGDVLEFG